MKSNFTDGKGTLKALLLLHRALLTGMLMFAVISVALKYFEMFPPSLAGSDRMLQVVAVVVSALAYIIGNSLFRKKAGEIRDAFNVSLQEKARAFKSACIIQWAMLEGAVLLNIIFFLLVGNYAFLALAIALILFFYLAGPSKTKLMLQLRISDEEVQKF